MHRTGSSPTTHSHAFFRTTLNWRIKRRQQRTGMVLVLVLVVIALLALGGYTFSELMLTERKAAEAQGRKLQTRALADSGIAMVMQFLSSDEETQLASGGRYNNPGMFRGQIVTDSPAPEDRGRFTVIAPLYDGGYRVGIRFGLEDESSRLNLNMLGVADKTIAGSGRTILMQLPGMTEDTADAILDWMDTDEETREMGAESDYYSGLTPAYAAKNAPLDSVEELLLVRGVFPRLLFGLDEDRNGVIDDRERTFEAELGVDNTDGLMDFGWAAYLTLSSAERNTRADGTPKINVNSDDLELLHEQLLEVFSEDWANFIITYRQNTPVKTATTAGVDPSAQTPPQQEQEAPPEIPEPDLSQPGKTKLKSVLDLIGARVRVQQSSSGGGSSSTSGREVRSPFMNVPEVMDAYLPDLMANLTVNPATSIPGRININQAPLVLILGIPGMTEEIAQQILIERIPEATTDYPGRQYETWLLSEGIVTLEQMKQFMPFITGSGSIYRATVVGFFDSRGPMSRIEAVIDASKGSPKLLLWRDFSHLGGNYSRIDLGSEAVE